MFYVFMIMSSFYLYNVLGLVHSTDTVMNIYIKTMVEDDDKEVVAQACTSVADIIRDYVYATLEPCKHKIM